MDLSNLFIMLFVAVTIVSFSLIKRKTLSSLNIALLTLVIFACSFNSSPAFATPNLAALGAKDSAIHQQQQTMEEDLKLTPGGGHYSGIEYGTRTAENEPPLSDETIKQSIEPYTNDNLIVSVTDRKSVV